MTGRQMMKRTARATHLNSFKSTEKKSMLMKGGASKNLRLERK
jgi:hypothetical protein